MHVQVLLYDGFDELDGIGPWEVFRAASTLGAPWRVEPATIDGAPEVTAANGLRLRVGNRLGSAGRPDLLVVPGGGWVSRAPAGAWAESERGTIPASLAELHRYGTVLGAVCTGTMLLAAAGLLAGRPAVTHHRAMDDLRNRGAFVVPARVVDDGDIVTSGGITSGLDLGLWLVERFAGPRIAHAVEGWLEYERRGVVWRRTP
jgi:transcriptional regulator GlxA family with amidase domain